MPGEASSRPNVQAIRQATVVLPHLGQSQLDTMLSQRLPLVHEAFLIALNDSTGRFRLNADSLNLLLASLALGELQVSGHVTIAGGQLAVMRRVLPTQPFLATRFDWLLHEPGVTDVPTWLRAFSMNALDDAANELEHDWLQTERRRSMVSRRAKSHCWPVRSTDVAWRPARLAVLLTGLGQHLRQGHPIPWVEVLLASLLDVVGLLNTVLWNSPRDDCHRALRWCLSQSDALASLVADAADTHAAMVRLHLT